MNIEDFKNNLKSEIKPKRYKHFVRGNKYECSLLTRIRIERSYLNAHTFQIGFSESPKCLCEHPNENTVHYITECWFYTE